VTRAFVTSAFLLLSVLVLWGAFTLGLETGRGEFLMNLGVEIMGIVITVAVVEWFLDRGRLQTQAREIAWDTLSAVEHAIWIWQGGPREVETDELLGIVHAVGESDPVPDFTENLFFNIGTRSKQVLHRDLKTVEALPGLIQALENFARLNAIREGKTPMGPLKIASILEDGIKALAKVLDQPQERHLSRLIRYRNPAAEEQAARHFGVGINVPGRKQGERAREGMPLG
jgi:hypothetical protein